MLMAIKNHSNVIRISSTGFSLLIFNTSRLRYEHDVCLSVRLSVTLVDCDHIVQQKVEIGHVTGYGSLRAEADPDRNIL